MFFWKKEINRRKMDHEEGEELGKNTWLQQRTSGMKCIFFLTVEWNDFFFFTKNGNELKCGKNNLNKGE